MSIAALRAVGAAGGRTALRWATALRAGCAIAALGVAAAGLAKVRILGYWWENPMPYQAAPKGLTSLDAAQCGVCHQEIYQEWQASTHAQALDDRQFQAEMGKEPETAWLCLNCHTPLQNQLARIAVAVKGSSAYQPVLEPNARFDAKLSREGVTCAVCHVRDGVVLGPWGDSKAPHPVRRDPQLLSEQACTQCHQATASYSDVLVCTFDTAHEWRSSPYATEGRACPSCHMPEVRRAVAVSGPVRHSRRHLFLGCKIPKREHLSDRERQYYDLFPSGLSVRIAGEAPAWKLVLTNAHAGHLLPTGDPERFILVKAELVNGAGGVIGRQNYRIGQKWVWNPKARKLSDNRLKPQEAREVPLRFSSPRDAKPAMIRVTVENWRMSAENAAYHKLTGVYPISAVVFREEKRLP